MRTGSLSDSIRRASGYEHANIKEVIRTTQIYGKARVPNLEPNAER